jgi:hypothetical protein
MTTTRTQWPRENGVARITFQLPRPGVENGSLRSDIQTGDCCEAWPRQSVARATLGTSYPVGRRSPSFVAYQKCAVASRKSADQGQSGNEAIEGQFKTGQSHRPKTFSIVHPLVIDSRATQGWLMWPDGRRAPDRLCTHTPQPFGCARRRWSAFSLPAPSVHLKIGSWPRHSVQSIEGQEESVVLVVDATGPVVTRPR